ncbi:hypothetical protein [Amycolatopsis rubida]|uniref:hypothetical protein n=1 Tax=Amycolatopsis rubida TaxID=112413 RepID=UPI00142F3B74|nr:hypothetical protein [Amycolatopsis rubida]
MPSTFTSAHDPLSVAWTLLAEITTVRPRQLSVTFAPSSVMVSGSPWPWISWVSASSGSAAGELLPGPARPGRRERRARGPDPPSRSPWRPGR